MPQINIGKSAGKDPVLLWSGGDKDFGEFQFIVGESPKDGVYFIINQGYSITTVTTWYSINQGREVMELSSMNQPKKELLTKGSFKGLERGDVIYFRYIIKREANPRA